MIEKELAGKKILILAGADVHIKVVKAAQELGVYTIVTDFLDPADAPAKLCADEYWMIDIMDVDAIVERCRKEKVDGVLAFCIDPAQMPYQRVCEKLGVPCYGTAEQFEILTNKRRFKDFCMAHGVGVVPEYSEADVEKGNVVYPVLVKPSVSRGSRGQTVCYCAGDIPAALALAKKESADGHALIERYMLGVQDMSFAYIVIDGEPYLLKCGDRVLGYVEDHLECQQIATLLPSVHAEQYVLENEPAVKNMIKALGVKFGAVFIQGFYENGQVFMYDPGMRFPGGDYDVVMRRCTGFDNMKSFVRFALTGDVTSCYGVPDHLYRLKGKACMILSVACRPGRIAHFSGMEKIAAHPWVFSASQRHHCGEMIPATGDIKQRVAEFVAELPSKDHVKEFVDFVYGNLRILDELGQDMIVSKVLINKMFGK